MEIQRIRKPKIFEISQKIKALCFKYFHSQAELLMTLYHRLDIYIIQLIISFLNSDLLLILVYINISWYCCDQNDFNGIYLDQRIKLRIRHLPPSSHDKTQPTLDIFVSIQKSYLPFFILLSIVVFSAPSSTQRWRIQTCFTSSNKFASICKILAKHNLTNLVHNVL